MIWLCGDTHGTLDLQKVEDYFENLSCYQEVSKNDYLIIRGDVDYVLTHTCPGHIAHMLVSDVYSGEEELQNFFDDISQKVDFVGWYFGHWHMDWMEGEY